MTRSSLCLGLASLTTLTGWTMSANAYAAPLGNDISINEIRIEMPGADTEHYVELKGTPGASLDGLAYIVVGDQSSVFPPQQNGYVEVFADLSGNVIGADGLFVIAESSFTLCAADLITPLNFEGNDNVTHMLVNNSCGLALASDLDSDNDGNIDSAVTCAILDSVALMQKLNPNGFDDEFVYSDTLVGPDGSIVPSHVYRCADTGAWAIGDAIVGTDDSACQENFNCGGGGGGGLAQINEIRIDDQSTDDNEYFELVGEPGTDLSGLFYIVIGDGSGGSGVLETIVSLDGQSIGSSGYFLAVTELFNLSGSPDMITGGNNLFENSDNVTHMLVRDLTGVAQDDLDTNDDGTLDLTPWSEILDSIALVESVGTGDLIYSDNTLGPAGNFPPAHSYRCRPDGTWTIGEFFESEGTDTPSFENLACPGSGGCGGTDPISCFQPNLAGGCADASCCRLVTDADLGCADNWDSGCVNLANSLCLGSGAPAKGLALSELRTKQGGQDLDEYLEISGPSGASLDGVSLVIVGGEGDDTNGVIEGAVNLSGFTMPASGFFVVAEDSFSLGIADKTEELPFNDNNNKTYLLVFNFTGVVNGDLDADNDCTLDSEPWDLLIDSVSIVDDGDAKGGLTNCIYSTTTAGPDQFFTPAHFFVCDTANGTWNYGPFGTNDAGSNDSPGSPNPTDCTAPSVCGDGICQDDETEESCPADCADFVCGDGSCDPGETSENCAADCGGGGTGCPEFDSRGIVYPCSDAITLYNAGCCTTWDSSCDDLLAGLCSFESSGPSSIFLSELRNDNVGADTEEYVEIRGTPGESMNGYSVIVIGDGASADGSGVIETWVPLFGNLDVNGLALIANPETFTLATPSIPVPGFSLENNDNVTVLLVYGYSAPEEDFDIDVGDDGVLDALQWVETADCIGLIETDPAVEGELLYCTGTIGPDATFMPKQIYFDCEAGTWMIGVFDPIGETDTPGALNPGCSGGEEPCPGDYDGNGVIEGPDLTQLLGAWNTNNSELDLTGDGFISGPDLTVLLGGWGGCSGGGG